MSERTFIVSLTRWYTMRVKVDDAELREGEDIEDFAHEVAMDGATASFDRPEARIVDDGWECDEIKEVLTDD